MGYAAAIFLIFGLFAIGKFGVKMWHRLQSRRDRSLAALVLYFRQKLWMTVGLGLFFGALYLVVVTLAHYYLTADVFVLFLDFGRKHPATVLYGGLCVVAINSALIYLVRLGVKSLYHRTDGKRTKL